LLQHLFDPSLQQQLPQLLLPLPSQRFLQQWALEELTRLIFAYFFLQTLYQL
jgi:hypothetical protein